MSIEKGRAFFRALGMEDRVIEFDVSSATVALAAEALGVEGKRIAKTLSFRNGQGCLLVVAAGDARVQLRQIEFRTQGRDHPILPAAPETEYLKCGISQIFRP